MDLTSVLDAWPECARVLSVSGEILHVNPAGLALVELDLDRVRGRSWALMWPPETRAPMQDAIAQAAAGKVGKFRGVCLSHGGKRLWLDTVVTPVRDGAGQVVRLLAVSRDISSAMESEAFLETLVRLLPNPILAKSARDGRYVLINEAAEAAFGLSSAETIGKDAYQLFPQNEARGFAEEDAAVIASRATRISEEEPITTRDGVRYFTTKKFATYDGDQPLHLVTLGEDVTERREAGVALRSALAEAEQANRAKSEFLANMSHEIRTPLNGIVAGADMLARADLDPRARELVKIIASSGATLERLLTDILDLARIEAGRIAIEATNFQLGELVRTTAALAKLQADEKGVAVKVEIAADVDRAFHGDPYRIRQVLLNLLSNAVKFTERGSVTVAVEMRPDGGVRVTVRDTGIGFKPEMKEQLFGRFHQADGSITRRFGGTGLGMTISRELTQLMGGSLDAEGREGEGATFWFDLPLVPAEMTEEAEEPALAETPDRSLRVLLADDHPTNRKVIELMLEDLAEVVSVENGAEALMALGNDIFDIVLMDMQMPVMDGLEATRRIRETQAAAGRRPVPLIMLTANALPEHVAASHAAGADRHLEKPVTLAGLLEAMNEVLAIDDAESFDAATG
ncbi:MAG: PAS domain-containing sensor histidine kinase [Phenylobacterium sp.]|uniref:PAS domain-containing protein n=1 Tax=Phenylobacterium sp. TaxID=1871053 RepID=UPI001224D324|nr:PAS domain-containing protein [Phenylobacterium sp.]TAJ71873.1 MAG: PAS domain-containing sensor histidine kinase [Phenylobacterium sp.]